MLDDISTYHKKETSLDSQSFDKVMASMTQKKTFGLFLSDHESDLGFVFDDKSAVCWSTTSDCCSETWFADIVGVDALKNGTIVSVTAIDMDDTGYSVQDGRGRQEFDQVYGYKVTTTAGWCDIIFRNSSNGYYGGAMLPQKAKPSDFQGWTHVESDYGAGAQSQLVASWVSERERNTLAAIAEIAEIAESGVKRHKKRRL